MPLLIVGYVLAALLPIIGFARLLWRAQADLDAAREDEALRAGTVTHTQIKAFFADRTAEHTNARSAVVWDIVLVGTGLIIGSATSIAALPGMLLG